jgi:circadian clock protein KaiB
VPPAAPLMPGAAVIRYRFTLYVAGDSPRSIQAVRNLRRLGDERFRGGYELAVIDVLADPDRAESARILTTPTLVKDFPLPSRRVTGDLSNIDEVLVALALYPDAMESST